MIDKKSIEDLAQRVDIADIISHYIEVKRQGSSLVCICPFHNDKNPSMHINSQKGFYHCFACKAGGNVFKFVMDYEKINFSEAVEKIANLSNFTLTYTKTNNNTYKSNKNILPLLNAFYKQNLSKNKEALHYLYKRALNDDDIRKFELGYAPSSNESLKLLQNENIDLKEALNVGALKKDNEKEEIYASFINRITFPIYDHKNLLIGFGGRTLNSDNFAKYVNSPQSVLFDKSRIFYALNLAKDSIIKQKEMIICEGYMDAIAFHKAGFTNAVAVLGTALTNHHLPIINRLEAKVILCFDNDEAGIKAAIRSSFLLSTNKIDGKVVILEGGKDPAELVANNQEKELYLLLEKGLELGEFYIRRLLDTFDLSSPLSKQKALENIQKYTFLLEPLIANSYKFLVAKFLGVDENFINLSKNKSNTKIQTKPIQKSQKNQITEMQICKFLLDHLEFKTLFFQISDIIYFNNKNLLEKILNNLGFDDEDIRELSFKHIIDLKNKNEFLLSICNINLVYFDKVSSSNISFAFKKQILDLINKNLLKIVKVLNDDEVFDFIKKILILLKEENDEVRLENLLKILLNTCKYSSYKNFYFDQDLQDNPF